MGLLEALTVGLGPSLMKAVAKLWLKDQPVAEAAATGAIDVLKKKIDDFTTRRATQQLFDNLQDEVASRLAATIEVEFGGLPEHDRVAAVLSVKVVFESLDLADEVARGDLDAARLMNAARPIAAANFRSLGGESERLAELLLAESCAYVVSLAGKLPDFELAATRELLRRTTVLQSELASVLDAVTKMRSEAATGRSREQASFETQYRRALVFRLDRLHLFGLRLVGAGTRDYELSVAYVTLTSTLAGDTQSGDVDVCLPTMQRIVVQGEAGSGKTTLLQWLAVRAANGDFMGALKGWNRLMPIYLKLRDYADNPFPRPELLIESTTPNLIGVMPTGWTHKVLATAALLIIDGIDEVPAARRDELFEWIESLSANFPSAVIVVSSRPAALDAARNGRTLAKQFARLGFRSLTLEPMSLHDSEALVTHWHAAVGRDLTGDEDLAKLERYDVALRKTLRERPAIASLASNPLMCAMICALNWDRQQELPNQRMELYELALEMLLHGRELERKIMAAHLAKLGSKAKEELLDGLAYWMLRNGYSEASLAEVVAQVSTLMMRLSAVNADPNEVTQELLERSGVLRQPQHGVVDFIHRTFLEYMAARAAVKQGDLGMLVERAQEESWRETIVFAAGHAEGAARDKLIGDLLKKPWFGFGSRPLEADVTTACCLETAGASLDPQLLARLQERSRALFPPNDFAGARLLWPAAELEPSLLCGHERKGAAVIAACIRCAGMVAGPAMLTVIESYAHVEALSVVDELLIAWPMFNSDEYLERVIAKMPLDESFKIEGFSADPELMRCLRLLALSGQYAGKMNSLANALEEFREGRRLSVGDSWHEAEERAERARAGQSEGDTAWLRPGSSRKERPRGLVSIADAERVAQLTSLEHLTVGKSDRGVLAALSGLSGLKSLSINVDDPADLEVLRVLSSLETLEINGLFLHDHSATYPLDLRVLEFCPQIQSLVLKHHGEDASPAAIRLPLACLRTLHSVYSPLAFLEQIETAGNLSTLTIQCTSFPQDSLVLGSLTKLKSLSIYTDQSNEVTLALPPSLTELRISRCHSFRIVNPQALAQLTDLMLYRTESIYQVSSLMGLQSLRNVHLTTGADTDPAFVAGVKAAARLHPQLRLVEQAL